MTDSRTVPLRPPPARLRPATPLALLALVALPLGPLAAQEEEGPPELGSSLVSGLELRNIGPALTSGRIGDIAVDPTDRDTWYVAVASGGVWKTVNGGTTWAPIFDGYGSYSIGTVTVDPHDPLTVWVGTGENNSQRSVSYGDGVYKSVDGGRSFENVGLGDSEHIGMIVVDPRDSDRVWVAAQGPLWEAGGDRGLYLTTDGGESWERKLHISEDTGISEVHLDPRNPEVIYAVAYQRRRHVWTLIDGGPESGIHKSTDGGESWEEVNRGLPSVDLGRIGLAISPQRPDVLYAIVEAARDEGGVFRSSDGGRHWSRRSDYVSSSPQYYQEIYADPHRFDRLYSMDTFLMASDDGGASWERVPGAWKHVDHHAMVFDPEDEEHWIVGTDGGVYETRDAGENWHFKDNLPVTQFYKVGIDEALPFYHVYGGTQDNNTQGGPSRTRNVHGITNREWFITVGGDGFDPAIDPENPDIVYSQWQYGNLVRYDRATGERIDIKPQEKADGPPLRFNWNSALLISPHDPARLYFGSQFLHRSDDRGNGWRTVSPDLTRDLDRNRLEVMGRVWGPDAVAKNTSTSFYGTIVSLTESPLAEGVIYTGSDDGLIQVTEDGGGSWRRIASLPGVPDTSYIADLEASRHDPDGVFVAVDDHKRGDFRPYLLRSDDRGRSWTSIAGDLPERGTVHTVVQDHEDPDLLFAGTEFGIWFTRDGGESWHELTGGMPTIAVRELEIQRREDDLVAASFGRGFFILDDYSPLRHLDAETLAREAAIFPVKKAWMYVEASPVGGGEKSDQGASFFTAPNPEFGATFTYYLRDTYRTLEALRHEREEALREAEEDVFYPPWDSLKAEDREEGPRTWLTVRDEAGNVVRRIDASTRKGVHRATWDFRYPGYTPVRLTGQGYGPMAVPGTYTVSLHKRVRGETTELVSPMPFTVEPLGTQSLPPASRDSLLAFQRRVGQLQRAVMGASAAVEETEERIEHVKRAIEVWPAAEPAWLDRARALELRLADLRERLRGDPTKPRRSEPAMPGILDRVQQIVYGGWSAVSGPTETHRKNLAIASDEYGEVAGALRTLIRQDLPALEADLESAGAPWTPGRGVPEWPPREP